ncbi:hypothetical protein ZOSMA_174G00220 [Zostera marina]|uniref:Uncharacterized protein n=1 Tax=Zostera marina TaxID=29655 RepID=A0A0K9PU98_ZOSMR|nr:hypothetical protein ZOSMA_174G00220 [Zostera marina]
MPRNHEYVARCFNRGSNFWSLGLRAFYFSFSLFLWIFGPIPMFINSSIMVVLLYFLDGSKESEVPRHARVADVDDDDDRS